MRRSPRRNFAQDKLRMYRIDKRHPKRASIQVSEDLGDRKRITELTTPRFERTEIEIPKKKGGEWQAIFDRNRLKIARFLPTGQIFMYVRNGEIAHYIGELEAPDLYMLGFKSLEAIDAFTTVINKRCRGRTYRRYLLRASRNFYKHDYPQTRSTD